MRVAIISVAKDAEARTEVISAQISRLTFAVPRKTHIEQQKLTMSVDIGVIPKNGEPVSKRPTIRDCLEKWGMSDTPEKVLVVGDRFFKDGVPRELTDAQELGMPFVQIKRPTDLATIEIEAHINGVILDWNGTLSHDNGKTLHPEGRKLLRRLQEKSEP